MTAPTIIKRPAIQRDDTKEWFYLPPFSLVVQADEDSVIDIRRNPVTGKYRQVRNHQTGWQIAISGIFKAKSDYDGIAFQQSFQAFLRSGLTGDSGVFHFVDWSGDGGVPRCYLNCYLSKGLNFVKLKGERVKSYTLAFTNTTLALAATSSDGTLPPAGPYDVLVPSAAKGGAAGGSGASGGGASGSTGGGDSGGTGNIIIPNGGATIVQTQSQQIVLTFPGIVDEVTGTPVDNVARLQRRVILSNYLAMQVKAIWIRSAIPGSGATRAVASTAPWNGGGTTLKAALAAADMYANPVAGTLTAAAGVPIYVYFDQSGGHSAIEVILEVMGQ